MWGHIERHGLCSNQCGGCVRIFEDDQKEGDEYRYSFPFKFIAAGIVELFGIRGKKYGGRAPTKSESAAMLRAFQAKGWTCIIERKSGAMIGTRIITRRGYRPQKG